MDPAASDSGNRIHGDSRIFGIFSWWVLMTTQKVRRIIPIGFDTEKW